MVQFVLSGSHVDLNPLLALPHFNHDFLQVDEDILKSSLLIYYYPHPSLCPSYTIYTNMSSNVSDNTLLQSTICLETTYRPQKSLALHQGIPTHPSPGTQSLLRRTSIVFELLAPAGVPNLRLSVQLVVLTKSRCSVIFVPRTYKSVPCRVFDWAVLHIKLFEELAPRLSCRISDCTYPWSVLLASPH